MYKSTDKKACYFPPIISNGKITFAVDCEGSLNFKSSDFTKNFNAIGGKVFNTFGGEIYHAGRRSLIYHDGPKGDILSFGTFSFNNGSEITDWTQELYENKGFVESVCNYADGSEICSKSFIHPQYNLFAVQKHFIGTDRNISFTYKFNTLPPSLQRTLRFVEYTPIENGAKASFSIEGQDLYTGEVNLFFDRNVNVDIGEDFVTFSADIKNDEKITMFICLDDDLIKKDYKEENLRIISLAKEKGFDVLLNENINDWENYFSEGYVKTGNEKIDSAYRTALYHLRCYSTRWSIPTGISNAHWHGKYFAFDEYYGMFGLLTSGRLNLAKKVPEFRLKNCLSKAISRSSIYSFGKDTEDNRQARFCWETSEYGEELSPAGFWHDHVFHMAVIAQGAYQYYEYSGDTEFLEECYPMIRACAKFYTLNMLYHDTSGKVYLGKCTDLERLGPSVENAFMTSCGIIKTLECFASAAEILNHDKAYCDECKELVIKLRESLPNDGEKYVPFSGCTQKSIAIFSGKFPFDVLPDNDEKTLPAFEDYKKNELVYGNMYAVGGGISSWYASWKAEGYARLKMPEEAYNSLVQALVSVGVFNEMFEINEATRIQIPWFTTTSGVYLSAVNEMLIQSTQDNIYILPAYPRENANISFKLPVKGGSVAEVEICNGELISFNLIAENNIPPKKYNVYFGGKEYGTVTAKSSK